MRIIFKYPNGNFNLQNVKHLPRIRDNIVNLDSGKEFVVTKVCHFRPFSQKPELVSRVEVTLEYVE